MGEIVVESQVENNNTFKIYRSLIDDHGDVVFIVKTNTIFFSCVTKTSGLFCLIGDLEDGMPYYYIHKEKVRYNRKNEVIYG